MSVQRSARLDDPGAELLTRTTDLWSRYGRIASVAALALLGVGALVYFTMRSRAATEEQAAGRLAEANLLYWQGEYKRSLEIARQVAQEYPSAPSGIDAHRLAGDNAYWDGDFKTAVNEYQAYLSKAKSGVLADAARRSLAYALESDHQYSAAAATYLKLVGVFDRESSAEFLYAAARCERAASQPAEAKKHLQRLIDEFGETSYASLARIEAAELGAASH